MTNQQQLKAYFADFKRLYSDYETLAKECFFETDLETKSHMQAKILSIQIEMECVNCSISQIIGGK